MPRLSLYSENKRNDYKYFDRIVREQLDVGGTTVNVHKYLGSGDDVTDEDSVTRIQDLLFLENRDRKYDPDVYSLRGHYTINDIDFDLSQFGLFMENDTLYIVFHINEMVQRLGRKIMSGDVLELPHLREFYPLDSTIPAALRRYYVVDDATRASEGYSPTWYPHLWRVKANPLVSGQEYQDLLNNINDDDDGLGGNDTDPLNDLLTTYNEQIEINDAIIEQAKADVSGAGYDTSEYYTVPLREDNDPNVSEYPTADSDQITTDSDHWTADNGFASPRQDGYSGYLTGDGIAPNGYPVTPAIEFPSNPSEGDYVLRLDYLPNRLFRYDGVKWIKIEDNVRQSYLPYEGNTLLGGFVSNNNTTTAQDGQTYTEKQYLNDMIKPKADE